MGCDPALQIPTNNYLADFRSLMLLQLELLTKLSEQGKLISGAPIIYIDLPSHLSLVLELPRQYSHYALCHTLLLNQSVRDRCSRSRLQ